MEKKKGLKKIKIYDMNSLVFKILGTPLRAVLVSRFDQTQRYNDDYLIQFTMHEFLYPHKAVSKYISKDIKTVSMLKG